MTLEETSPIAAAALAPQFLGKLQMVFFEEPKTDSLTSKFRRS